MPSIININLLKTCVFALSLLAICACSDDNTDSIHDGEMPITFRVSHPRQTRATETAFEEGDRIGVFVASDTVTLETGSNIADNIPLTLGNGDWTAPRTLYWDRGTYNVFAYYPYINDIVSTDKLPFSINTDQSMPKTSSTLGGYEASDFLYASCMDIAASAKPVNLQFRHIMSKLKIRLIKGEDYEGELPTTAKVHIHNTMVNATIDLNTGTVTPTNNSPRKSIIARQEGDYTYSAIIVPQAIEYRLPLVEVEMKGISYLFETNFVFKTGMEYLINLIIDDDPEKASIEIGGEIVNWQ